VIPTIGFTPYLFQQPFQINDCDIQEGSSGPITDIECGVPLDAIKEPGAASYKSMVMSGMLLFNLALVHHTMDRNSVKAHAIYQIAMKLLLTLPTPTDSKSLLLHVVVLNNCGVWCYENSNNNVETASVYFEEIMNVFDEAYTTVDDDNDELDHFDDTAKRGLYSNIQAFFDN
jgi:hypothetical protein